MFFWQIIGDSILYILVDGGERGGLEKLMNFWFTLYFLDHASVFLGKVELIFNIFVKVGEFG